MTLEEFKVEYVGLFNSMMQYSPEQVGSDVFAEKMAVLADMYPAYAEIVESEI